MSKIKVLHKKVKFIKEISIILFISILAGFTYNGISDQQIPLLYKPFIVESGSTLSISDARMIHKYKSALFIDARIKEEFDAGHIPDAINIPANLGRSDKIKLLEQLPKNLQIIVYCENPQCHFAERMAKEMHYMKFKSVVVFNGGWDAWNSTESN